MKSFIKRMQCIGITLILLRAAYVYAKTTEIYQPEKVEALEEDFEDELDLKQHVGQIAQLAVAGANIMQTIPREPQKIMYLKEIPESGESDLNYRGRYIAYKDMLILWSDYVYKRQNGVYRLTGQTLSDVTKIDESTINGVYRQCGNLIVMMDREETMFLVYDMDTGASCSYPCGEGRRLDSLNWWVYEGEIYYTEDKETDNGGWTQDTAIRKMNPHTGESVEIYRGEKPDLDNFWFFIRDDGTIFFEWIEWSINYVDGQAYSYAHRREYWKIQPNGDGTWAETKLCEIDRWKFREWGPCNAYGFFVLGQYFEPTRITDENGESYTTLFEEIVIKDNGETETPVWVDGGLQLACDNGYLSSDVVQQEVEKEEEEDSHDEPQETGSVTYYDYHGNAVNTWQLIDKDYIEKGYELVNLLYYDGTITGFYQQEETKELYIAQVDAELYPEEKDEN